MPKYIVQHTPVKSGGKRYEVGSEIELPADVAARLGDNLKPAADLKEAGAKAPAQKRAGGGDK